MREMSGEPMKLHMRFKKPWPSAQGMAIWGDFAFQLFHTGQCAVFDLKSGDPEPLCTFPLGSFNEGTPADEYTNHANQCMFSAVHRNGNPLPLLYVTIGCGIGADVDGYYYRCAVEDIRLEYDADGRPVGGSAEWIQTISYRDGDMAGLPWKQPCWGCPAWFVDNERQAVYMFSCRYRTTPAFRKYYAVNEYIMRGLRALRAAGYRRSVYRALRYSLYSGRHDRREQALLHLRLRGRGSARRHPDR